MGQEGVTKSKSDARLQSLQWAFNVSMLQLVWSLHDSLTWSEWFGYVTEAAVMILFVFVVVRIFAEAFGGSRKSTQDNPKP